MGGGGGAHMAPKTQNNCDAFFQIVQNNVKFVIDCVSYVLCADVPISHFTHHERKKKNRGEKTRKFLYRISVAPATQDYVVRAKCINLHNINSRSERRTTYFHCMSFTIGMFLLLQRLAF